MSHLRQQQRQLRRHSQDEQHNYIVPKSHLTPSIAALDMLFCFDTTISMYRFLEQVRSDLGRLSRVIQDNIPKSRVGVIAYGDYCDAKTAYVTRSLGLTTDIDTISQFLWRVQKTDGGDFPEAVEEALFAANQVNWRLGSRRAIALIGDAPPHGVIDSTRNCKYGHFWQQEIKTLKRKGIKLYAIQCGRQRDTERVFREMARETGGVYLNLSNISDLVDLLIGVCMQEVGLLMTFQEQLRQTQRLTTSKKSLLNCLGHGSGGRLLP
ncbi:von Willebrand factor type A [[Leptolyngbya] sp. PCC 7376]|uniref:vWA domain-containing protein n=1 Tax=[Leptolyngbya] sp. PCC 7376 TaxID=111781 RepID=UPI00029F28EE|nr:vWA domain-containing protein [[Leptolyngbya] sp. PCC 7376]AFY37221.1 von Willebrand factor type A [[Leptolyngbya] sp. PCC 7376]